jgi:hypothetical protein
MNAFDFFRSRLRWSRKIDLQGASDNVVRGAFWHLEEEISGPVINGAGDAFSEILSCAPR